MAAKSKRKGRKAAPKKAGKATSRAKPAVAKKAPVKRKAAPKKVARKAAPKAAARSATRKAKSVIGAEDATTPASPTPSASAVTSKPRFGGDQLTFFDLK